MKIVTMSILALTLWVTPAAANPVSIPVCIVKGAPLSIQFPIELNVRAGTRGELEPPGQHHGDWMVGRILLPGYTITIMYRAGRTGGLRLLGLDSEKMDLCFDEPISISDFEVTVEPNNSRSAIRAGIDKISVVDDIRDCESKTK